MVREVGTGRFLVVCGCSRSASRSSGAAAVVVHVRDVAVAAAAATPPIHQFGELRHQHVHCDACRARPRLPMAHRARLHSRSIVRRETTDANTCRVRHRAAARAARGAAAGARAGGPAAGLRGGPALRPRDSRPVRQPGGRRSRSSVRRLARRGVGDAAAGDRQPVDGRAAAVVARRAAGRARVAGAAVRAARRRARLPARHLLAARRVRRLRLREGRVHRRLAGGAAPLLARRRVCDGHAHPLHAGRRPTPSCRRPASSPCSAPRSRATSR